MPNMPLALFLISSQHEKLTSRTIFVLAVFYSTTIGMFHCGDLEKYSGKRTWTQSLFVSNGFFDAKIQLELELIN